MYVGILHHRRKHAVQLFAYLDCLSRADLVGLSNSKQRRLWIRRQCWCCNITSSSDAVSSSIKHLFLYARQLLWILNIAAAATLLFERKSFEIMCAVRFISTVYLICLVINLAVFKSFFCPYTCRVSMFTGLQHGAWVSEGIQSGELTEDNLFQELFVTLVILGTGLSLILCCDPGLEP